jgi:hypothetical protein
MAHDNCGCNADVPDWILAWQCPGCRARFLAGLPSREWRQQAINEWRKAGEVEMVAAVKRLLNEMQPTKPFKDARKGT